MAIPDYQTVMLPLLEFARDNQVHHIQAAYKDISERFQLTVEEQRELLPSGKQRVIESRVHWARTYLVKAGFLHSPKRGYFQITDQGIALLDNNPESITLDMLRESTGFRKFFDGSKKKKKVNSTGTKNQVQQTQTPEEILENTVQQMNANLADELLVVIKSCSPQFFERLVVELLVIMGYGGSRKEAGEVLGHSGDGGIDGIIKEDKLGLDAVYIQAKRWDSVVGRPEIQRFVGALHGQKARKGVFITTSQYSKEARDYVGNIDNRVVLIDGLELANLMIEYDLGISTVDTYRVKRIDSDYFIDS